MRIGFDVDGILAEFEQGYAELIMKVTGKDLFGEPKPWWPHGDPPVWYWTQHFGYTQSEDNACWTVIKNDKYFWEGLPSLPGVGAFLRCKALYSGEHEIYFVTNRLGIDPKGQTERWLQRALMLNNPTVLVSEEKGAACKALHLDCYIDDKKENVIDAFVNGRWVEKGGAKQTRVYRLKRAYNADTPFMVDAGLEGLVGPSHIAVDSVAEFLKLEGLE